MEPLTITRDQLHRLIEEGRSVAILEILPESSFRTAHLPGALNLPPDRIDSVLALVPDRRTAIVVYCADLACPNSTHAARRLAELGYVDIRNYAAGKQDWLSAGLPMESDSSRTMPAGDVDALPVSCSLGADALAARSRAVRRDLFAGVDEVEEFAGGFSYRFPSGDAWRDRLIAFVAEERTCCAFFRIELVFEAGMGPIWLRLSGPAGVKDFIRERFDV